jgi:malonyl-CoA decarboxylase
VSPILGDLLSRVAEAGRGLVPDGRRARRGGAQLAEGVGGLLEGRGEATGLAEARETLEAFAALPERERAAFFRVVVERFGPDAERLEAALARWRASPGPSEARALHAAAEPRSQELIRRLARAPGGARALVAMRGDLLRVLGEDPALAALDRDFEHLFSSWFNRGFLELRRIDWSSPAAVLEKIIRYEAVHDISGWDDLRRRVGSPDRRLYAFFHPALAEDPLIFVEVALARGMPAAIGPILAEAREPMAPAAADTACFYSISNCQSGLRGVSFGSFLIKQVVEELRAELPALRNFVTLSPVPGLRAWARAEAAREDGALEAEEREAALALDRPEAGWGAIAERAEALARMAALYLVAAKRPQGGPLDPVARFHLGNGARLERINPCADAGPRGVAGAWGVMVNYRYDLDQIERRHEAYAATGDTAAAPAVRRLAGR